MPGNLKNVSEPWGSSPCPVTSDRSQKTWSKLQRGPLLNIMAKTNEIWHLFPANLVYIVRMNTGAIWQQIAERLAESGWTWQHRKLVNRTERRIHVAEARNDNGEWHAVVADAVAPAFVALEQSINETGQTS